MEDVLKFTILLSRLCTSCDNYILFKRLVLDVKDGSIEIYDLSMNFESLILMDLL